jgi:hypothetical protein
MKNQLTLIAILISNFYCFGQEKKFYTLDDYSKHHKLDYIIEVESNKDTLKIYGYDKNDDSNLVCRKVKLNRYEVLGVNEWSWAFSSGHFKPLPVSLTTVPFKVRPKLDEFKTNASSGTTNLGLNFDLGRWKTERYFATGKKSIHKFYGGIWIAPSVEELDSLQTRGFLKGGSKSKQLFVSTALTINYAYNNLTFTFVPIGIDLATSSTGKEWIYNEKRWWGFGIGLEPKFLNTITNK